MPSTWKRTWSANTWNGLLLWEPPGFDLVGMRRNFGDPGGVDGVRPPFDIPKRINAGLLVELRFADAGYFHPVGQGQVIVVHAAGQEDGPEQQKQNIFHVDKTGALSRT